MSLLGKTEERDTFTVREANYHHPDNGALYTGEWRVDRKVRQGWGSLTRTNGEHYCGYFVRNKFHGKGKLTFSEEEEDGKKQFIGLFRNGKLDGYGTMTWSNGDTCKARWVQDETLSIQGVGLYTWSSGVQASVSTTESGMVFSNKLVFPDQDFRKEYTGDCING